MLYFRTLLLGSKLFKFKFNNKLRLVGILVLARIYVTVAEVGDSAIFQLIRKGLETTNASPHCSDDKRVVPTYAMTFSFNIYLLL